MARQDAPYDNFALVQRTRDLDPGGVAPVGSAGVDERRRLEGGGRVVERPSRT